MTDDLLSLQYLLRGLHVKKFDAMQPKYVRSTNANTTQKALIYFGNPTTSRRKNTRSENFPAQSVVQKRSICLDHNQHLEP